MSLVDPSHPFSAFTVIYRTAVTMGRGIRRLVSLFESLDVIINEADNRLQAEADGRVPLQPTTDEEIEADEA